MLPFTIPAQFFRLDKTINIPIGEKFHPVLDIPTVSCWFSIKKSLLSGKQVTCEPTGPHAYYSLVVSVIRLFWIFQKPPALQFIVSSTSDIIWGPQKQQSICALITFSHTVHLHVANGHSEPATLSQLLKIKCWPNWTGTDVLERKIKLTCISTQFYFFLKKFEEKVFFTICTKMKLF